MTKIFCSFKRFEENKEKILKNKIKKNIYRHFFLGEYFSILLESSETYSDPSLNEIGAKLNFLSKTYKKRKMNFVKRKTKKKSENI